MSKLFILGDSHGDFDWYVKTVKELNAQGHKTFHVGDFGIGFPRQEEWNQYWLDDPDNLAEMNSVIAGNHDNPLYARNCPLFLPRFGYDEETRIFWISGAASIDTWWRTEHVNWWSNEELSYAEMKECEELYEKVRPKIVISHDGPADILNIMFPQKVIQTDIPVSSTQNFLQHLFEMHQPEFHFFGHWHQDFRLCEEYTMTEFRCVGEKSVVDMDNDLRDIWKSGLE